MVNIIVSVKVSVNGNVFVYISINFMNISNVNFMVVFDVIVSVHVNATVSINAGVILNANVIDHANVVVNVNGIVIGIINVIVNII